MPVSRLHQGRFRAISSRLPKPYRQIYLSQVCHSGIRPVKISSSGGVRYLNLPIVELTDEEGNLQSRFTPYALEVDAGYAYAWRGF